MRPNISKITTPVYKNYINIKKEFEEWYKVTAGSMVGMLGKLKLPLDGKHHSRIDDTKNIAKILIKMTQDGYTMTREKLAFFRDNTMAHGGAGA